MVAAIERMDAVQTPDLFMASAISVVESLFS